MADGGSTGEKRGHGRAKKPETDQRLFPVKANLTAAEALTVKAAASDAGMGLAAYVRARVLGVRVDPAAAQTRAEVFQLERIGANLNQLLKRGHAIGFHPQDVAELAELVAEIRAQVASRGKPPAR